jgi:UDP-galactopyranose mutase
MIVIVGSGLSGSVLARLYANTLNKKVLIIEKRDHIAGNIYDYIDENGILCSKYGAHLFHTNNDRVWNFVQEFSEWIQWEHKVLGRIGNKLFPIPVNINTVNILLTEHIENIEEMNDWLDKNQSKFECPKNGEESCKNRVGEKLYELIFKNYTKKQWDKYPDELDQCVLNRIPIRNNFDDRYFTDKYQALPKDGYTKFIENMITHSNIKIMLNTNYFDIKDTLTDVELTIYTGPIDQYFSDVGYEKLEYRSINFVEKTIDKEYFQENSVVNYPDSEVPFTRIVEYKHFLNQKSIKTKICYEYTTKIGEPYYPVFNKKNMELYDKYKEMAENIKNVYFVGRLANYKYFNMDEAILNSLELFDKFTNLTNNTL